MHTPKLFNQLRQRFIDVLGSIYLYNEYRGYTSLDRILIAAQATCADDPLLLADIAQHRADERKHYVMFKRFFELRHIMPLQVDRSCGHIDRFVERIFGCTIDDLDTDAVIADPSLFERLCRVIMLTEQRGERQVDILLNNRLVRRDAVLVRIFEIVKKDEPRHWRPYHRWLVLRGRATALWREQAADWMIHKSLMLVKLPWLFINWRTPRMAQWPDEAPVTA